MKIQVTLMVEESKELIAIGILEHMKMKNAWQNGRIVLKGGTTVSRISARLTGRPLAICGRMTERGTVDGLHEMTDSHVLMIADNRSIPIDDVYMERLMTLGPDDVYVCSPNAMDAYGNAVIMAGDQDGGEIGYALSVCYANGVSVLIPAGIEKMVPGNLRDVVKKSGRKTKDISMGMAVGLVPMEGEIFTEIEAVQQLARVECAAIGAGGIGMAQGSVTLDIWGDEQEVQTVLEIVTALKKESLEVSGVKETLVECKAPCIHCKDHVACWYKSGYMKEK